ncbi:MAG: hypothetical protein A2W93_02720 [Bacteroidetes bacterium GWF2_43_63]|nr:MAG: hypothetical protein A2W94_08725 [Bacteroidetes bacterium GWE2_42_42]OFY53581.1 MAG: hypothetical protein A2W93_02720 [Bacteroidetes bacterium GWF2_43_63]HBG71086.1 DNA alkylation repair protein [Bacteroidales bacterium]HCB63664.1 DNA alkylation repair protein [Bacteroidales bacterium]HCY24413.1 DNA alkylation repair protein [Bacteroidales bacterium]
MTIKEYHKCLSDALQAAANPVVAAGAKKYMKDQSEFFGVGSPLRKEILGDFLKTNKLPDIKNIPAFAELCWNSPQREMQYCCMEIMFRVRKKITPEHIPLFEKLIQNKGWWDSVDFIAPSLAGFVLKNNPEIIDDVVSRWQNHDNMWMRRSAILHQLKYKNDTNEKRLFETCKKLAHEKEFFIRKAIGWALREYSKVNPEAVKQFVARTELSGLSQREALKRIQ